MYRHIKLSLLTTAIAATNTVAYTASDDLENNALAISKTKTLFTQTAIVTEQHANGKASRVEYENSK